VLIALAAFAGVAWAAKPLPDLIVQSAGAPSDGVGGSTISVRDTVLNKGRAAARASANTYYLSVDDRKDAKDIPLKGQRNVPGLKPGRSSAGKAQVVLPTNATGLFEILVCANGRGKVRESSQKNNCTATRKPINVTLPPPATSG
jgi:subtilase family serine protease